VHHASDERAAPPAQPVRSAGRGPSRVGRHTRWLFGATLLISLLAKGTGLQQGFGFDDYGFALHGGQGGLLLWQARTGGALLQGILERLRLESVHAGFVWVAALIAVLALFGTLVARQWGLHRRRAVGLPVAALIAIHPYTCDTLHMRSAIAPAATMLALLCLLLVPRVWTRRRLLGGILVFAVAVAIYGLALHYLVVVALVGAGVAWGRYLAWGSRLRWSPRARALLRPRRILRHSSSALLACAAGGTLLYAGSAAAFLAWRDVEVTARTRLLPAGDLGVRAGQVLHRLRGFLVGADPLLPPPAQWLLLMAVGLVVVGLLTRVASRPRPLAFAVALAAIAALASGLIASLGVLLVLAEFWPAPRIMASAAIVWAGVFALAHHLWGPRIRRPLVALGAVVLATFVGIDNRILGDQLRLNRRDAQKANRIAMRLELAPGFSPQAPLVVVGASGPYPHSFATKTYDTNVSAFGAAWARTPILVEATGFRFAEPNEAQTAVGIAHCRRVAPYPGPEAVVVRDGVAIVCLSAPP
jgi:hypothetical protein